MKALKADDIVSFLDAFEGKISLSEILNQEIPLLNSLRESKARKLQEIIQARTKAKEAQEQKTKKEAVTKAKIKKIKKKEV